MLVVVALTLAYSFRVRFRPATISAIYVAGLALFLGFGYWSFVLGFTFFLPFFGVRLLRQDGA